MATSTSCCIRVCHSDRDLPADAPSRMRALAEFVTPRAHLRHEVFRGHDPRPAFHEFREYMKALRIRAFVARQVTRLRGRLRLHGAVLPTTRDHGPAEVVGS